MDDVEGDEVVVIDGEEVKPVVEAKVLVEAEVELMVFYHGFLI